MNDGTLITTGSRPAVRLERHLADPPAVVAALPAPAPPHWVWVNDFVFPHMTDGQALLDLGRSDHERVVRIDVNVVAAEQDWAVAA